MIIDAQGLSNTSAKNTSFPPHISSIFDTTHQHYNNNADTLQPILTSEEIFISFFQYVFLNTRFNLTAQIYYNLLCVATLTVGRSKLCNGCNTVLITILSIEGHVTVSCNDVFAKTGIYL